MLVSLLFCAAFVAISFLPKSSLTITTFSSKRTTWFVPQARRCLLINLFHHFSLGTACHETARFGSVILPRNERGIT
jgi:hypothetical protein